MLYLNITECKILTGISRLRQTYVLLCYNATVVWACHRKSHISPGNVQCGRLHVKKVHVWLFFPELIPFLQQTDYILLKWTVLAHA